MEIQRVSNLAKSSMSEKDYNTFMNRINSQHLNSARLFVEDRMDEIIFSKRVSVVDTTKLQHLKQLDTIVTNEYINQIDVKDVQTVSFK